MWSATEAEADVAGPKLIARQSEVKKGHTVKVPINLKNVASGVSATSMIIRLANPRVAEIVGADFSNFGLVQVAQVSGSEIHVTASDLADVFGEDQTNHRLGDLTIRGLRRGRTKIDIDLLALDDDNGDAIDPELPNRYLKVTLLSLTTKRVPIAVGDIVPIPVTLKDIPSGVSQFDLTISLSDPNVASLAGMNMPDYGESEIEQISISEIRIMVTDANNLIEGEVRSHALVFLNIIAQEPGQTEIRLTLNGMTDDEGNPMEPVVRSRTFTIE